MKYELYTQDETPDILTCEVEYNISPYRPERLYLPNGDPGYPAEGGEIEDVVVKWRGVDITTKITDQEWKELKIDIKKYLTDKSTMI